jgi:hypothetical protein
VYYRENEDEVEESYTDGCEVIGWMERLSERCELLGKATVEDEVTV